MSAPDVDVVVALHDPSRPVGRCVSSLLAGAGSHVRVTVACHELDPDDVAPLVPADPRVRLLPVRDGLGSPSGPYNAGIDAATARYVSIIGSDDFLEPGALSAWTRAADRLGSDVMLARVRMQDGTEVHTPRVRPLRSRDLDLVRDRLAYRTAPLGLMRRATLDALELRLVEGMRSGGDVAFTARLWSSGVRVDLARSAPRYVVGTDAVTRVTTSVRPITDELRAFDDLVSRPWLPDLTPAARRAIAVKSVRIHLLGAIRRRREETDWHEGEPQWLRDLLTRWVDLAPGVLRPFSRADRALLAAALDPQVTAASLVEAVAARAAAGRWDAVLTPSPADNLDRESTLRYLAADRFWR
ncbi:MULTISPECIES: glycosyltransferase [Georgenia]|uniref:glycosyltransferase family 2 protein n=1 Tax=Georgenia TaxID=154116 RepID=UPI00143D0DA4|nr:MULTISPECIES: glycosyltransferase [Georgenia]